MPSTGNAYDKLMSDLGFPRRVMNEATEALLWLLYRNHCSPVARAKLIAEHVGLVVHTALAIYPRLPRHVELAEVAAMGMPGLIAAVDKFEPSRGVMFTTFAGHRIHGEMIEGLRRIDRAVGRQARARRNEFDRLVAQSRAAHGRPPTREEIDRDLPAMTLRVRANWWQDVRRAKPTASLDLVAGEQDGRDATFRELLADPSAGQPIDRVDAEDEFDAMMIGLPTDVATLVKLIRDEPEFTARTSNSVAPSVSALAERLNVCQSTVSKRLRAAREHFDAYRRLGVPAPPPPVDPVTTLAGRQTVTRCPQPRRKFRPKQPTAQRKLIAAEFWPLLTPRQREVFEHRSRGLTTSQIAAAMNVSPHTVKATAKHARARIAAKGAGHA